MTAAKKFIPTALTFSKTELEKWVKQLKKYFKDIQIDVVDASVDKQTYFDDIETFEVVKDFNKVSVHLMISDPVLYLKNKSNVLKKDGTIYIFKYFKLGSVLDLKQLKKLGYKIGISFEPDDSLEINPEVLSLINEVMFVLVTPGKSGRDPKIEMLQDLNSFYEKHKLDVFDNLNVSIDGGLKISNLQKYINSKANIIYSNSFFKTNGVEEAISLLTSYK